MDLLFWPQLRPRDELRFLLEGDLVFCRSGGGGDDGGSGDDDGAQGGDGGESQEDNDGAQGGDGDDHEETLNPEQARKLRSENRNLRTRAKSAEKKLTDRERQDLDESERLKRENDDAVKRADKAEADARSLRVRFAAVEVGIRPQAAAAAAALVDWDDVDADDDKAVTDALKALKKEHEYLFAVEPPKRTDVDGGKKGGGGNADADVTPGVARLRRAYATKD